MPGQAVSDMVGITTIRHRREQATATLGERLDIRQFHDVALGVGTVPLPVLDARMQRSIDAQQASP